MDTLQNNLPETTEQNQSSPNNDALIQMANELMTATTTKPSFKEKLKSRKFWLSAAGCVVGICGMIGFNDNTTAIIAFAVLEVLSILIYCISEGKIDAARCAKLVEALQTLLGMIDSAQKGEDIPMPYIEYEQDTNHESDDDTDNQIQIQEYTELSNFEE